MSGFHWPAYLLWVAAVAAGFFLLRRWYAKEQSRSLAMLVVMVGLMVVPMVFRSLAMGINWNGMGLYRLLALFVLPAVLVAGSSRVRGYEKLCWTLVSLFLSWLGFLVFMVVHGGRPAATRG